MKSYIAKAQEVEKKWYVVDAAGKPLGRVASQVATILRGKHKPTFTPNVDCGDFVIVINAEKVVLTGKKLDQKFMRKYSGYVGGLKEVPYREVLAKKPEHNTKGIILSAMVETYALLGFVISFMLVNMI